MISFQIFRELELPAEIERLTEMRSTVRRERQSFLQTLVNNTGEAAHSEKLLSLQLAEYERSIQEAAQSGLLLDADHSLPVETDKWSIVQAIFFCSTVITSIGYGSLVPASLDELM